MTNQTKTKLRKGEIKYKGAVYRLADLESTTDDSKAEEAKSDIGKVRERIKGALGLVHDKKWDEASKLLEELLEDLKEAKEDVETEAKE